MQAKALRSAVDSGFEVRPYGDRACHPRRPRALPAARLPARSLRKKSSRSTRADSPTTRAAARRRWPWRRPAWFACRSSPSTTTGGFRRTSRLSKRPCARCRNKGIATILPSHRSRLHHLLRRPGLVPGGRRALEAVLSAASRPPGFQPDARQNNPENDGGWRPSGDVGGKPGMLYQTAVACFVLAIPNRYLPILQEGKIDSLRKQFEKK